MGLEDVINNSGQMNKMTTLFKCVRLKAFKILDLLSTDESGKFFCEDLVFIIYMSLAHPSQGSYMSL